MSCSWTDSARSRQGRPTAPRAIGFVVVGLFWMAPTWLMLAGCQADAPSRAESLGLSGEYVDLEREGESAVVLRLNDNGTFAYLLGPRERGEVAPPSELIGEGTWSYDADSLRLAGGNWTASFVADSIWVEIPRRGAMLSSLRWVTSSEGSPFSACNLVSRPEFNELLHPSAGTGSAQSAW